MLLKYSLWFLRTGYLHFVLITGFNSNLVFYYHWITTANYRFTWLIEIALADNFPIVPSCPNMITSSIEKRKKDGDAQNSNWCHWADKDTESVVCYTRVHLTRTTDNHVHCFKKLHKDSSHYFYYYYLLQSRVDFVWVIAWLTKQRTVTVTSRLKSNTGLP